jgi:hypothetical protein
MSDLVLWFPWKFHMNFVTCLVVHLMYHASQNIEKFVMNRIMSSRHEDIISSNTKPVFFLMMQRAREWEVVEWIWWLNGCNGSLTGRKRATLRLMT